MTGDKILMVGGGGREHALGWRIRLSPLVSEVFYAPGNGGTQEEKKGRNIPIDPNDFDALFDFVKQEKIDMVVVGPEQPLANGIVDSFNRRGYYRIVGPKKKTTWLETDKFESFDMMNALNIPQANGIKCYTIEEAKEAIREMTNLEGVVIKAQGLTEGKGVKVCNSRDHALGQIENHIELYGKKVLISERLRGQEFSVFGISDGNKVLPLEISFQDHKPLLERGRGPNTGGMGAYGPAPIASSEVVKGISKNIMQRVVDETGYKGILYAGMIMNSGGPKVLEWNIRFGDPECQPAMMQLSPETDFYEVLSASLEGRLEVEMKFKPGASCCVVLAAEGYPDSKKYKDKIGTPIFGIKEAEEDQRVKVFHAGTSRRTFNAGTMDEDSDIFINGGRVLGVTAHSPSGLEEAQEAAYQGVRKIVEATGEENLHYRTDIGNEASAA